MGQVTVTPEAFSNVFFDVADIERVASTLLGQIGLDVDVRIEVDESTPLGKVRLASLDPLVLAVESGALEDNKRPRQFGEAEAADALGRALLKAADRLDADFGAPNLDDPPPLTHSVAWDTYVAGRFARLGYAPQRQRRVYTFELRHGFTDAALAAFDQLWSADGLTFAQIATISDEARTAIDAA